MPINNVSFGNVVAVSGKSNKINRLNTRLRDNAAQGKVIMKDVTAQYINASPNGLIAEAAQKGDRIEIYITGDDVKKVKTRNSEFSTIDGILSHMSSYFSINKLSVGEAVSKIFEK